MQHVSFFYSRNQIIDNMEIIQYQRIIKSYLHIHQNSNENFSISDLILLIKFFLNQVSFDTNTRNYFGILPQNWKFWKFVEVAEETGLCTILLHVCCIFIRAVTLLLPIRAVLTLIQTIYRSIIAIKSTLEYQINNKSYKT